MTDLTLSGLVAMPMVHHIHLTWGADSPVIVDVVEVWAGPTNYRSLAELVGVGDKTGFTHLLTAEYEEFFYWIRAKDADGNTGDWFPEDEEGGVQADIGPHKHRVHAGVGQSPSGGSNNDIWFEIGLDTPFLKIHKNVEGTWNLLFTYTPPP